MKTKLWTIRITATDGTREYRQVIAATPEKALTALNDEERARVTYMSGEEVEYVQ